MNTHPCTSPHQFKNSIGINIKEYVIPLQTGRWRVTVGSVLTSSNEAVLKLLQPCGLILGAGFVVRVF
jgi:hypothetical protein